MESIRVLSRHQGMGVDSLADEKVREVFSELERERAAEGLYPYEGNWLTQEDEYDEQTWPAVEQEMKDSSLRCGT